MWVCIVEVCVRCVCGGNCVVREMFGFGVNLVVGWLHLMSSLAN